MAPITQWLEVDCCCPNCGEHFNRIGDPNNEIDPTPGYYSVCIYCAAVLVIRPDLSPDLADPEQLAEAFRGDPSFADYVQKFRQMILETKEAVTKH